MKSKRKALMNMLKNKRGRKGTKKKVAGKKTSKKESK